MCSTLVSTCHFHICPWYARETSIYIRILYCINHSGSRNVCFDLLQVAFKLKMVGIVPSANNSITVWRFLVEGTRDKERGWGGRGSSVD